MIHILTRKIYEPKISKKPQVFLKKVNQSRQTLKLRRRGQFATTTLTQCYCQMKYILLVASII